MATETGFNIARLVVKNGATTLYDDSVFTQTIELHGANYSFTVLEGGAYDVRSLTSSSMTGFSTYALQITTVSTLFSVELIDTTTAVFVINTGSPLSATGLTAYRFNVRTNAATVTANLTNTGAVTRTVTVNGGAPFTIAAGITSTVTGIPKNNIDIVVT